MSAATNTDSVKKPKGTVGRPHPVTPLVQERAVELSGWAAETLKLYRERVEQLKNEQPKRRKPDMTAFAELKNTRTPQRRHGELPGIPVGLCLRGRGEAAILGIHEDITKGISALQDDPCYAISLSGKYADDRETDDGKIYYSGEGGKGENDKQVKDQDWENPRNASLRLSVKTQTPVRVIRATTNKDREIRYVYLGLYRCVKYTYETGKDGFKVYMFTLVPSMEHGNSTPRFSPLVRSNRSKLACKTPRRKQQQVMHPTPRFTPLVLSTRSKLPCKTPRRKQQQVKQPTTVRRGSKKLTVHDRLNKSMNKNMRRLSRS
ncbi:protein ligase UHRF1 [Seminavis robusta]|uniref:Protein ligase UHRF1 n=1 Tax=Seminavis robusta TaxID=568900 RepID=A0A9N8HSJ1_9STRA|nr:protein ligase UHRF1 [Seminavis robusta]|eukprot:Sro1450_g273770.1 protein ligase UHRF1 (319) ;mRNA; r:7623-8579